MNFKEIAEAWSSASDGLGFLIGVVVIVLMLFAMFLVVYFLKNTTGLALIVAGFVSGVYRIEIYNYFKNWKHPDNS